MLLPAAIGEKVFDCSHIPNRGQCGVKFLTKLSGDSLSAVFAELDSSPKRPVADRSCVGVLDSHQEKSSEISDQRDGYWSDHEPSLTGPSTLGQDDAAIALRPLGEHRLKDIDAPVVLHQLVGECVTQLPPLRTVSSSHPTNLPPRLAPLIGRDREVVAVMELVRSTDFSVVTLVGPGGTGKTRLALAGTIKSCYMGSECRLESSPFKPRTVRALS
jgi:hypothetical protein